MESAATCSLGDRSTSDVDVRIRTFGGRNVLINCHRQILVQSSQYFAKCLSEKLSNCETVDSRICIDVYCKESDIDHLVSLVRLFYFTGDDLMVNSCHSVKNTVELLKIAIDLGCPKFITICANYLEAVPWGESEEDDILQMIPKLGSQAEPILARLQPVNKASIKRIFLSAAQFAMSSPHLSLNELKISAQEQTEYMLSEDKDSPMFTPDNDSREDVKLHAMELFARFKILIEENLSLDDPPESSDSDDGCPLMLSYLSDLSWACKILTKMDMMKDFVHSWVDESARILEAVMKISSTTSIVETKIRVIEIVDRVMHIVESGYVVITTPKRLQMIKHWLPFVQTTKSFLDSAFEGEENDARHDPEGKIWESIQSSFASIILTLPSEDQAEILTKWLQSKHVMYPDLTEAFEMWCHRSKTARNRIHNLWTGNGTNARLQ